MYDYCVIYLDEFEALCGNRKKGFKIVDTLTGPRVQGMYVSLKGNIINLDAQGLSNSFEWTV